VQDLFFFVWQDAEEILKMIPFDISSAPATPRTPYIFPQVSWLSLTLFPEDPFA
jgi:hypothetical protein